MGRNKDDFMDLDWDFLEGDNISSSQNNCFSESNNNGVFVNQESNISDISSNPSGSSTFSSEPKEKSKPKNNSKGLYDSSIKDINSYWEYYLDKLEEITSLSPSEYKSFINQLKMPLYGGRWDSYDKDRLRFFLAYMALRYSDVHYYETEFFGDSESYTEILDSIDGYVKDMKERTDEAEFMYYVANMYSADRFQGIDPMDKLNEFWKELQGFQLNDNITEFKSDYWEEKAKNTYSFMISILETDNENTSNSNSSNNSSYNPNQHDIFKRVKKIIMDKLSVGSSEIHLNARFAEDLGADSLDTVELIMEFEKEFNITIPDERAKYIRTVGNAIAYIRAHAL